MLSQFAGMPWFSASPLVSITAYVLNPDESQPVVAMSAAVDFDL